MEFTAAVRTTSSFQKPNRIWHATVRQMPILLRFPNQERKELMSSAPFDILRRHSDGSFIWLEAASELSHAKDRLQQLNAAIPGEYFVFDQNSQQIVARIVSSLPPGD
jgi:hypothetical protein